MARKSPLQLQRLAFYLLRQGHEPARIADLLGLHPGGIANLVGDAGRRTGMPAARAGNGAGRHS